MQEEDTTIDEVFIRFYNAASVAFQSHCDGNDGASRAFVNEARDEGGRLIVLLNNEVTTDAR